MQLSGDCFHHERLRDIPFVQIGYGEVNYNNTFEDYTMLTGQTLNLPSLTAHISH